MSPIHDLASFERIALQYRGIMYRYARLSIRNMEAAEGIVDNCLGALWYHHERFEDYNAIRKYLRQMLNKYCNQWLEQEKIFMRYRAGDCAGDAFIQQQWC